MIIVAHLNTPELTIWRLQAWNLALRYIREAEDPGIVIADVDGTCLDGAEYDQRLHDLGQRWPDGWAEYVRSAEPPAIPGAERALQHAVCYGHVVWYVSARYEEQAEDTRRQLDAAGLPEGAVICAGSPQRKRGLVVDMMCHVNRKLVVQVGDQLRDITMADAPGVLIPNPVHGSWTKWEG
jgi:predicted secreted acid phosphatase